MNVMRSETAHCQCRNMSGVLSAATSVSCFVKDFVLVLYTNQVHLPAVAIIPSSVEAFLGNFSPYAFLGVLGKIKHMPSASHIRRVFDGQYAQYFLFLEEDGPSLLGVSAWKRAAILHRKFLDKMIQS
ncbi:uncharacterized protein LOC125779535 [Bactrocera dorsalis]|uniref:Uncharacterized protein LOC125779535 n=1 Tax=Bactrocera dorsalis TaxID=27457 RepID=A0ABM3K5U2_BACDO|nr:uncharacterized protein LOC125779535 [Bactrocera dorsalis]XP_049316857.1 uncharacterized protein LOC125779535 [Bactrocera dorsalis]